MLELLSISFKILIGINRDFLNLSVGENQNFEWQHCCVRESLKTWVDVFTACVQRGC